MVFSFDFFDIVFIVTKVVYTYDISFNRQLSQRPWPSEDNAVASSFLHHIHGCQKVSLEGYKISHGRIQPSEADEILASSHMVQECLTCCSHSFRKRGSYNGPIGPGDSVDELLDIPKPPRPHQISPSIYFLSNPTS